MVEKKTGTAIYRKNLSPVLAIFRLIPEAGSVFPEYLPGQFIALRRDNCRLTRKIVHPDGSVEFLPDTTEKGLVNRGPVTHSYSISSAPYETRDNGYLEFYVILQMQETGIPGRLTESLFAIDPHEDNRITYYSKISGEFTLEKRAANVRNIVLVGTGTGVAPFVSMIKQIHHDSQNGTTFDKRVTLVHTNRGLRELGYHDELTVIERAHRFDFVYVPTISRPSRTESPNSVGFGRANNVLRLLFDLPMKEEETYGGKSEKSGEALIHRAVPPALPAHLSGDLLRERMPPGDTVILVCGNPDLMTDIIEVAGRVGIPCEKEDW